VKKKSQAFVVRRVAASHPMGMRTPIVVTLFLGTLALPSLALARADDPKPAEIQATRPNRAEREEKKPAQDADLVDIGVLGGIGFPHPLAIEAVVGLHKTVMIGAEYSFLPKTTISSVDARMWSAAADLRVFPFHGAFFVGLRGGYQSITADTTLSAANIGSYTESVDVGTWFVNPRIGFLWIWKPFALGIDAGVQIPLSTTVSRSSLLALASPTTDAQITSATNTLGRTVIPTLDLIRIGVVF
jgi:hypothetical protein